MAPNSPDQKRKRGRLPSAQKHTLDASDRNTQSDNDTDNAEEDSRPRKRGRKADPIEELPPDSPETQRTAVSRKGRPSKQQREQKQMGASANAPPRKHVPNESADASQGDSRFSKGKGKPMPTTDDPVSSEPRRGTRERRAFNPDVVYGTKQQDTSADVSRPPQPKTRRPKGSSEPNKPISKSQRSARPRSARDPGEGSNSAQPVDAIEKKPTQHTSKKKLKKQENSTQEEESTDKRDDAARPNAKGKGRRQTTSLNGQGITKEKPHKKPQEKPSRPQKTSEGKKKTKSRGSAADSSENAPPTRPGRPKASAPTTQAPDKGKSAKSRVPTREERSKTAENSKVKKDVPPEASRNRDTVDDEDSGSSETEAKPQFRHLRETNKNISRSTVASKWNRLGVPAINVVSSLTADAQRPVLFRLQNTNRRREHASAAMGVVSRRLRVKLVKGLPFPAPTLGGSSRGNFGSYEDELDFERTVDSVQNLENTLNPLLHSVHLLEKEIKKQEDALAKDYKSLHRLENNARQKTVEWREKAKREHALASGVKQKDQEPHYELADQLDLMAPVEHGPSGGLFTDHQDEELAMLMKQIGSHVESLRSNLQQIDGVVPAINKSRAALQQVLLKHLDEEQYGSVLLG